DGFLPSGEFVLLELAGDDGEISGEFPNFPSGELVISGVNVTMRYTSRSVSLIFPDVETSRSGSPAVLEGGGSVTQLFLDSPPRCHLVPQINCEPRYEYAIEAQFTRWTERSGMTGEILQEALFPTSGDAYFYSSSAA